MEKNNNALLRHLAAMPAAAIYALADKGHLFTGFELSKRSIVSNLRWSDDGASLSLLLSDDAEYRVSLTLLHGELSASCNCGVWSPRGRCPHLVAALATLKKALSPNSFPMLQLRPEYLKGLRSQLLTESPLSTGSSAATGTEVEEGYTLLLDRDGDELRIGLLQDGAPLTLSDPRISSAVREYLRLLASPPLRTRGIEEFLSRFGGSSPILYLHHGEELPLRFDYTTRHSLQLQFDLQGDAVVVRSRLDDGTSLDDSSFVCESYYFDLRQGRVARVPQTAAERFQKRLLRLVRHDLGGKSLPAADGLRLTVAEFNRLQYAVSEETFAEFLENSRLCIAGEKTLPRPVAPRYRLNVLELADTVHLAAEGVAEDVAYPVSRETFWFFPGEARQKLPQGLKAKKRMMAILDACFATLEGATATDRDRIVRSALSGTDFVRRGVRGEARTLITDFSQSVFDPRMMLQVSGGEWLCIKVDATTEARLLQIACQTYGYDIFTGTDVPGEMKLDRKLFMKNLSRLRDLLGAQGHALAIGGEELETVSWSFTLDATKSSIDWFELRPEIHSEGELVSEAEFLEAVQGGGLFRRGNALVMLDDLSSRTLSLFTGNQKREVVRVPRLQILDWIALRKSGVRVLLSPEDEQVIESLTKFESIPKRKIPERLQATLRNYQCDGYNWLAFLYEHRFGACLADDMGLGKTIQAIALMAGLFEGVIASGAPAGSPHLVVVPPTLIFNWETELARFYPHFRIGVYRGQGRQADFSGVDLVLTSYGVVQRDIEELRHLQFDVIVFDEAQAVKNIHAETTGAVRRLKGRFKVALTGTPVENHLGEYFSVMDLALPGLLGPYEQFRRQMGREGEGFLEALITRTHPFILRRSKDMIAAELPPKVETDLYLEMSPRQKALYARTVTQVKKTVADAYRSNAPGQARIIALTAILKLRQICLSSRLMLPESGESSPKIDFLTDQLEELFAEGHSVLVFSQFTSFLDIVEEELVRQRLPFYRLDGTTPVRRRKDLVEQFQESAEPTVFLLSLKAGGRGLNLTRASYVFHLDPWWNPAVESQASDRAHRIGQRNQVTITRLLMRHSIEEKMMELKKRKLKLYRALLEDAGQGGAAGIGPEDFEFLLG
jgi:superfamily II DNA or RNA helicase